MDASSRFALGWPARIARGRMIDSMRSRRLAAVLSACLCLSAGWISAQGTPKDQGISKADEYVVRRMLSDAYDAVKRNYYDPTFHGVDLDARYHAYDQKLNSASSMNAGLTLVAGFLSGLHDSHTYFVPPTRPYKIDYGYRLAPIGDQTFVTRVRPGTDASGKV